MQALLGIPLLLAFCWLISENRQQIQYGSVGKALLLQIVLAILIFKVPAVSYMILKLAAFVTALKDATLQGTQFVFGYLGGGESPFPLKSSSLGTPFIFAFQALPVIIVVSALSMLLFYWRILPFIVRILSWGLKSLLNLGGALGTATATKIFLGNIDTALVVRPYLKDFSRSELFTLMACGMATTSMAVMPIYGDILAGSVEAPLQHLIASTLLNIPAAIALSQILIPHTGPVTNASLTIPYHFSGPMDAIARGTSEGLTIFLNIIAMLIVTLALVSLANMVLGLFAFSFTEPLTLQKILGFFLAPLAWLMGISWAESGVAGQLLGIKTVLNEMLAFADLKQQAPALSSHTTIILIYALCGFANFSVIGIMLGGLTTMIPDKRQMVIGLGLKSLIIGGLASCLSGMVVGLLLTFFS